MTGQDVIDRKRDAYKQTQTRIKQIGAQTYNTFTKDERLVVQFGMFPHDKMIAADKALKAEMEIIGVEEDARDLSRWLTVAIMDAANAGPQKMVV